MTHFPIVKRCKMPEDGNLNNFKFDLFQYLISHLHASLSNCVQTKFCTSMGFISIKIAA